MTQIWTRTTQTLNAWHRSGHVQHKHSMHDTDRDRLHVQHKHSMHDVHTFYWQWTILHDDVTSSHGTDGEVVQSWPGVTSKKPVHGGDFHFFCIFQPRFGSRDPSWPSSLRSWPMLRSISLSILWPYVTSAHEYSWGGLWWHRNTTRGSLLHADFLRRTGNRWNTRLSACVVAESPDSATLSFFLKTSTSRSMDL